MGRRGGHQANVYWANRTAGEALCVAPDDPSHEPSKEVPAAPDRVYVIRCGDRVKIGWSRSVQRRIRGIQVQHPEKIELVGTLVGGRPLERLLHERFAAHRVRGEWFTPEVLPDLIEMIRADEEFYVAA